MKRRRLILLLWLWFIPGLVLAWPWSRDMMNQPSIKPQEGMMVPFPARSVPVGGYPTMVKRRLEAYRLANPVPVTAASVARGQQYFTIFCVPCHGTTGKGDGPVGKKLPLPPMDLTNDYIQEQVFDNWIFATITFGGRLMPAYGNDLAPEERWDIVNYVRTDLVSTSRQPSTPAMVQPQGESRGIR